MDRVASTGVRGHVYRTRTAHASNAGRLAAPLARGAQHRRDCHGGTPVPPRGTQNPLWCQPRDGRGTGRDRGREMAHTMVTHRETASRWAAEPLCQSHIITRISRSDTSPRSSPCALYCSRNALQSSDRTDHLLGHRALRGNLVRPRKSVPRARVVFACRAQRLHRTTCLAIGSAPPSGHVASMHVVSGMCCDLEQLGTAQILLMDSDCRAGTSGVGQSILLECSFEKGCAHLRPPSW